MTPVPSFVFAHRWAVEADPATVFDVLADVWSYPIWWPQVRAVRFIDEDNGVALIRSALPITMRLTLRRVEQDGADGRLRVTIGGDLIGWSSFDVRDAGAGATIADYRQQVSVARPLLARLAPLAKPVLRWNHTAMMAAGHRGLTSYLALRRS